MNNLKLTQRELQVLRGLIEGQTQGCIALNLGISRKTVNQYCKSLRQKFESNSTTAAVAQAVKLGLDNQNQAEICDERSGN